MFISHDNYEVLLEITADQMTTFEARLKNQRELNAFVTTACSLISNKQRKLLPLHTFISHQFSHILVVRMFHKRKLNKHIRLDTVTKSIRGTTFE